MDTIFINTENGKTSEPHRFRLYLTNKLDLRRSKTIALANLSIYYTWENINSKYKNNKFKISGPTWSQTFDLQMDHTKYQIFKTNNRPKIENRTSRTRFITLYVQNDYLQNSKLLYEFVPDKTFGQLISVKPIVFIQCKTSASIFDYIEIWFTDQNNNSLQIEDKVSVTLIIQNNRL